MILAESDRELLKRLEDRVERLLRAHGIWYPTPGEFEDYSWELRVEGLLFHQTSSVANRKYLSIQTLPLESPSSRVLYNKIFPEVASFDVLKGRVIPLIDRMLVLDDLAEACR